uniref:Phospholipase/carboxylesterase/thioesterase domain-containing protein n=1 Tax=Glycine max TaxID=3847 RepID=A0A0R0J4Z9_SOYBN
MSYPHYHMGSAIFRHYMPSAGSRTASRSLEFGKTHVVRPKGKHQATIVWLHGLGDNGLSSYQLLESLPLPNIKWICPTAPSRPVTILGGFSCTAWFDMGELSEDGPVDWESLDASASHIANLLSTEPADVQFVTVKVGIGGFSMGAAVAQYSATCFAMGRYGNGIPYPVNLRAVVGLSGWLPGSRSLRNKIEVSHEARRRAALLPVLLSHGISDDVVLYKYGEKSAQSLSSAGFRYITFKSYDGLGHYTVPREMDEVSNWLSSRLGLGGST